jgi:hypothetical protein
LAAQIFSYSYPVDTIDLPVTVVINELFVVKVAQCMHRFYKTTWPSL